MLKIVILAGGTGTRLWPMSTAQKPKQFQKLVSDKTMLQETYERVLFAGPENILVSTNADYVPLVKEQLPDLPVENIISEPSMQDTGPCIGLAAALIAKKDPEAVMAVVYADHWVQDKKEFQAALTLGAKIAERENTLNIVEVKAKFPNTNLGYVKIGHMLSEEDGHEIYAFKEFKEKPDSETAKKFFSSNDYLWNTGYYIWKVGRILEEFKKHLPNTHAHLSAIQNGESIEEHYPQCEKISIDYAVMEKVDPTDVRIIPANLGWSDIGTWKSLHEELTKNPSDNLSKGNVVLKDTEGSVVYNEGENLIAAHGLRNMVVVNVNGTTLVCPIDKSVDLKSIVQEIHESKNT